MVLRVCRGLLGTTDADDAWQETFLAAMRAYPDLREGSNVAGWLATIAYNKAIDQIRRADRAGRLAERLASDPLEAKVAHPVDAGAHGGDASASLERTGSHPPAARGVGIRATDDESQDDRLVGALACLTTRQRAAIVHHHVAGLPYAEVARIMGGTEAAARRSASDGIARLRALWDREGADMEEQDR